jgi:hypothetical protein
MLSIRRCQDAGLSPCVLYRLLDGMLDMGCTWLHKEWLRRGLVSSTLWSPCEMSMHLGLGREGNNFLNQADFF